MPIPIGVLAQAGAGGVAPFVPISNAYVHLSTIAADQTASVTFSDLNSTYGSTYKHLELRLNTTNRNGVKTVNFRFNGDTSTNYNHHKIYYSAVNVGVLSSATTSATEIPVATAYSASDDRENSCIVRILYAFDANKFKTINAQAIEANSDTSAKEISFTSGAWRNTNAITSITIFNSDSTWFRTSRISLYGIRG